MDFRRCMFIFLFILSGFGALTAQPIQTYGPACKDVNLAVTLYFNINAPFAPGYFLVASDSNFVSSYFGTQFFPQYPDSAMEKRLFFQWNLARHVIPYGSQIKTATLTLQYTPGDSTLPYRIVQIPRRLALADYYELWMESEASWLARDSAVGGSDTLRFDSTSAFVDALQTSLVDSVNDNYFSLCLINECMHGYWDSWFLLNACDFKLTIEFTRPEGYCDVTITNEVHGIEPYVKERSRVRGDENQWLADGSVDQDSLPSFERPPVTKTWLWDNNHIAETWFTRYDSTDDWQKEKSHLWNDESDRYQVQYGVSDYSGQTRTFNNRSRDVFQSTIQMNNELYWEGDYIPFQFHDPWRVKQVDSVERQDQEDYFVDQQSPYFPWEDPKSYGVFLDQEWDQHLPHYTVRPSRYLEYNAVDNQFTYKDYELPLDEGDGIFLDDIQLGTGWYLEHTDSQDGTGSSDDYRTVDLKFVEDSSVVIGRYKMHLCSDVEYAPTMRGSQRKIGVDSQGVYHVVYESAGEIWYVNSTDGGQTWNPEELVTNLQPHSSRPNPGSTNPSLAVVNNCVYVVYNHDGDIVLRTRYQGLWDSPLNSILGTSTFGSAARPVIDVGRGCFDQGQTRGEMVLVVWESSNCLQYAARWLRDNTYIGQLAGTFANMTEGQPYNPSLTCLSDPGHFGTAWRENYKIYYRDMTLWNCNNFMWEQGSIEIASDTSSPGDPCMYAPSLTHAKDSLPVLAYEAFRITQFPYANRWINVRKRTFSNGWQAADVTIPDANETYVNQPYSCWNEPLNPTIGAITYDEGCFIGTGSGLCVAYQKDCEVGFRTLRIACSPSYSDQIDEGKFPNMIAFNPFGSLHQVYSNPGSFQWGMNYVIRSTNNNLPKTVTHPLNQLKEISIRRDAGRSLLTLSVPRLEHQNQSTDDLEWRCANDSLVIGINTTLAEKTRTAPFTVEPGMRLVYTQMLHGTRVAGFPTNLHYRIQIRDTLTNAMLIEHQIQARSISEDTSIWSEHGIQLNTIAGQTVYATVVVTGDTNNCTIRVNNVLLPETSIPKRSASGNTASTPQNVLLQNHPNPFDRTTVIEYQIAAPGWVRLSVRDLLGRELAVLVDDYRNAGPASTVFDASSLPAGSYLISLQANGETITRRVAFRGGGR